MNPLVSAKEQGFARVILSRATGLDMSQADLPVCFAPVVAGRTVWEAVPEDKNSVVVVEDPNYFGRREREAEVDGTVWRIDHGDWPATDLDASQHLAASLRQIRGLNLPHGQPEAPWFVASLPTSASATVAALDDAGFCGCVALERSFPEFPGGIRIAVAWPQHANARFCTIVRTVI